MDGLIALSRLLRAAGELGVDRLRPQRADSVPSVLADLSPAWLTRALGPATADVRVRSFEILDEHSGTTTRARIGLKYENRSDRRGLPDTLFVKVAPHALAQRLFVTVLGLGRNEVGFYRGIRPGLSVRAPQVYAAVSSAGGRFVLLLEDLAATGARFAVVGDRASLEQARSVMTELARLHAAFWQSPRFSADLAWVPSFENKKAGMPLERFLTGQMVRQAQRRFASDLDLDLKRVGDLAVQRRDHLEDLWARGPRTLVHGDCHIGNLFFEGDRTGFLDWQVLHRAPGMRDVSYFLCHSLPGDLRRARERELIDLYLATLADGGVAPPDRSSAWDQYRSFSVYAWIAAAFTAAAGAGLQAREIAVAGLRRATRAVIDLESVDWIESEIRR